MIEDGLVGMGILKGDGPRHVKSILLKTPIIGKEEGVYVTISEAS